MGRQPTRSACPPPWLWAPPAGARTALPDERIQDIIKDMRPALRGGDFSAAVERGVVGIGLGLAGGRPKGALRGGPHEGRAVTRGRQGLILKMCQQLVLAARPANLRSFRRR